jgi:hypothetical protein
MNNPGDKLSIPKREDTGRNKQIGFLAFQMVKLKYHLNNMRRILKPVVSAGEFSMIDKAHLSISSLIRHMLFSMLCFFAAWMMVVIFQNAIHALLLYLNGIHFSYSLFAITYLPGDIYEWDEGNMLLIYSLPYFGYFLLGAFLASKTGRMLLISWKLRLLLTWISMHLMVFFMASVLKGVFVYREFGIAFQWVIEVFYLRLFIAGIIIVFAVWYVKRTTVYLFLKSVPVRIFLSSEILRKSWLAWVAGISVLPGILLAFLLWRPYMAFYVVSTLLIFPLIIPAIIYSSAYMPALRIPKTNKFVPSYTFIVSVLAAIWVALKLLSGYSFIING